MLITIQQHTELQENKLFALSFSSKNTFSLHCGHCSKISAVSCSFRQTHVKITVMENQTMYATTDSSATKRV